MVGHSESMPLAKACAEVFATKRGAQKMPLEREVLSNRAESRVGNVESRSLHIRAGRP
jgi:hypothetical protein